MEQYSNTAIHLTNASKTYGKRMVLQNLNMHVEKGAIYGLLGSSGCGKTTLLNCIVGRKNLDSGEVWVLGGQPGSRTSGVPGPRVGYMPQNVALVAEFTVKSVIYYFGRIYGMSDKDIQAKLRQLTSLLDLPHAEKFIAQCSGGEQRRISFAAALVSTPELLVLDEPTVGLDPLLRERIWDYLLKLTDCNLTSVIITTHYIEEARQANKVGMLRDGKLLAEESPDRLLLRFQTNSLESVFLTLCSQGNGSESNSEVTLHTSSSYPTNSISERRQVLKSNTNQIITKTINKTNTYALNYHRIKALSGKSWLQVTKNYGGVAFMFVFPIFQILSFFMAVGHDVKHIKIAVCNHENDFKPCTNYNSSNSAILLQNGYCEFNQLGCRFVEKLNDSMIDTVVYGDLAQAKHDIRHGKITGVIYIPENFSVYFQDKVIDRAYDRTTLNYSQFQVWLDMSNHQIGTELKRKLVNKIVDFQKALFSDCNMKQKAASIPINFEEQIYGRLDDTFTVFMVPSVILMTLYFLASSNAINLMITDRLEGIWDRSIVAGVSCVEIILVHFATQFIIMSIQAAIVLIITFPIYQITNSGSFAAVIIIALLAGVCGITYGFFIAIVSNSHSMGHIIATGSFFPLILLCGLLWPIEGMPKALQWFSRCLPLTVPTISLRNVMKRGWSLTHKDVMTGIGIQLVWILILLAMSLVALKRRK